MTPADGFPSIVAKTVTDRYGEDTDNAYKQESYTKIGDCGAAMVVQCGRDFERSGADDDAEGERDLLDRGAVSYTHLDVYKRQITRSWTRKGT